MISRRDGSDASYYIYDGGLSVRALTSAAGTVTDTLVFDAFGNETAKTGSTDNHYGFQGEEKDETGLYYLRARYMDPSTGTFTSMDTYGGSLSDPMSLHKYLFANSNPVMNSDPSGHFSAKEELGVIAIQGVLGAAVSGVMYRLDWIINDPGSERHSWGGFAWQVIYGFVYGALSAKLGFGLLGLNLSIYDYFIIAIISQIASLEIKDMAEVLGKQTGNPLVWGILNGIGDGTQVVSNAATSAVIVKGLQGLRNSKQSVSGNNKRVVSSETNSACDNTSDGGNRVKVGRWMSKEEYGEMVRTGKVQQSTNNINGTHVSYPADPNSFKGHSTNAVYVEFEVDPSRLANAGRSDWKIVTAPGSYIDRLNQARGGAPYTGMPNAYNIVVLGGG